MVLIWPGATKSIGAGTLLTMTLTPASVVGTVPATVGWNVVPSIGPGGPKLAPKIEMISPGEMGRVAA
jgi:hypothetical protein